MTECNSFEEFTKSYGVEYEKDGIKIPFNMPDDIFKLIMFHQVKMNKIAEFLTDLAHIIQFRPEIFYELAKTLSNCKKIENSN